MSLPARVDLTAYRGDTWTQTFRFLEDDQPVDLTGSTVAATATNGTTTVPLQVTVGPDPGTVTLSFAAPVPATKYDYDVEVTAADSTVTTWVRGKLVVTQDITNAA